MAKWEMRPVFVNGSYIEPKSVADGGRAGADPAEFPKMLYRGESAAGGPQIAGWTLAHDESQERVLQGQGWCVKQEDALSNVHKQQQEFARLAANRAHNDRMMSGKAQDEARRIDESTIEHLPSIPETPIRKRRTKAQMEAAKAKPS